VAEVHSRQLLALQRVQVFPAKKDPETQEVQVVVEAEQVKQGSAH
jgi:hypothetical protein